MSLYIKGVKGVTSSLGYQQITSLSAAAGLTVPSDPSKPPATVAVIIPEGQTVRWRDDGVSPTALIGMPLIADDPLVYAGDLTGIKFIETASGAKLNISYYATATPLPVPVQLTPPTVNGTTNQTGDLTVTSGTYSTGTVVTTLIRAGSPETTPYAKSTDDALITFWARDTVTSGGVDYVFDSVPLTVASSAEPTPPPDVIDVDFADADDGDTLVDLGFDFTAVGSGYQAEADTYTVHSDGYLYLDAVGSSETSLFSIDGSTSNIEIRCTARNATSPDSETGTRRVLASISDDKTAYFFLQVTTNSGNTRMGYSTGGPGGETPFYNQVGGFVGGVPNGQNFSLYIDRAGQTAYQMLNGVVVPVPSGTLGETADGGIDISGDAIPGTAGVTATATVGVRDFGNTYWPTNPPPYPVSEKLQILSYDPSTDIQIVDLSYDPDNDQIAYALANVVTQAQLTILDVTSPDYPEIVSGYANIAETGTIAATIPGSFVYLFRDTANPGAVVESDQVNVFGLRPSRVGMNAGTFAGIEYWNQDFSCYADRMNQAEWYGDHNRRLYQNGPNPDACFDKANRLISWPGDEVVRLNIGWCINALDEGVYEWCTGGIYTIANYSLSLTGSNVWNIYGSADVTVDTVNPGPNGGVKITLGTLDGTDWYIQLKGLPAPMTENTFRLIGEPDPTQNMTQGWVDAKTIYNGDTRWMQWGVEGFGNWGGVIEPSSPEIQWQAEKGYTSAQWLANFPSWANRYTAGKFIPEYGVETANRSGSPYYVNLPWVATDDYLHGFFAYLAANLDPSIDRVAVETENEVWNDAVPDYAWFFLQGYRAGLNGDTPSRSPRTVVAQDAVASVFAGSISSSVLTVTGSPTGTLHVGQYIEVAGLAPGAIISSQLTGTTGGAGTYQLVSNAFIADVSSTTINAWNPSNERVTGIYPAGTLLFRKLYGTSYKACIFEAKRTTTNLDLPTSGSVGSGNGDWLCVASHWETTSVSGKEALGNGFAGTWRYWAVQAQRIMNIAKQYIDPGRLVAVLGAFTDWTTSNFLTMSSSTDPVYIALTFPETDGGEGLLDVMNGYVDVTDAPYLPNTNICSMTSGIAMSAPGATRQAAMAAAFNAAWDAQKDAGFAKIYNKRAYLANLAAKPRTVNGETVQYSPARIGKGYYEGSQQFRVVDYTADMTGGTGGVSSTTLTVSAVNSGSLGTIDGSNFAPGQYVYTVDGSGNRTPLNVHITAHPSGVVGGTGTYSLSGAVTIANGTHLAAGNDGQFITDANANLRSAAIEASLTEFLEYAWRYGGSGCLFDEGTPHFDGSINQSAWTWFDAIPSDYATPTPGTPAALVGFLGGL